MFNFKKTKYIIAVFFCLFFSYSLAQLNYLPRNFHNFQGRGNVTVYFLNPQGIVWSNQYLNEYKIENLKWFEANSKSGITFSNGERVLLFRNSQGEIATAIVVAETAEIDENIYIKEITDDVISQAKKGESISMIKKSSLSGKSNVIIYLGNRPWPNNISLSPANCGIDFSGPNGCYFYFSPREQYSNSVYAWRGENSTTNCILRFPNDIVANVKMEIGEIPSWGDVVALFPIKIDEQMSESITNGERIVFTLTSGTGKQFGRVVIERK